MYFFGPVSQPPLRFCPVYAEAPMHNLEPAISLRDKDVSRNRPASYTRSSNV